jgi:transcriptional regulator with XRE-family HTH domain
MTQPLLDADLIRRRRMALGLSERDLAKRLGVTGFTVNALERAANHDDLPAGMIGALAEALALTPNELFNTPTGTQRPEVTVDAAAVGGLLAGDGRLVPTAALAEVLGWTGERVTAALDGLAVRLPEVGQRLHRLGNDVSIVAAVAPADRLEGLSRRVMAARGLTTHQAQLLYRAWCGQLTPTMPSNPDRVTLGVLTNAGLLTVPDRVTRGELPQLTDDVRFSLALDDPAPGGPAPGTSGAAGAAAARTLTRMRGPA